MSRNDADDVVRYYPTRAAREAADKAIDALPDSESMARHIAVWVDAYRAAGGLREGGGQW